METTELMDLLSRGDDSRLQFKAHMPNTDALAAKIVAFCNTAGERTPLKDEVEEYGHCDQKTHTIYSKCIIIKMIR